MTRRSAYPLKPLLIRELVGEASRRRAARADHGDVDRARARRADRVDNSGRAHAECRRISGPEIDRGRAAETTPGDGHARATRLGPRGRSHPRAHRIADARAD